MFLVGALGWWYRAGWAGRALLIRERLANVADLFSFSVISRTLFAPFRQISAGQVGNTLAAQVRVFADNLFSRVFGAVVRTFIVIFGAVALLITLVVGFIELIVWPLIPLLPIAGVVLFSLGVVL